MSNMTANGQIAVSLRVHAATALYHGQDVGPGELAAVILVHEPVGSNDQLEVSFQSEQFAFNFTASAVAADCANGVVRGVGQASGDIRGQFAYLAELGPHHGLKLRLTEGSGAEVLVLTTSEDSVLKAVAPAQAPPTTCECQAVLNGTSVFGTVLAIDICPGCQLANSVFHLEIQFLGRLLIFDATTFTGTTCTETPQGLEVMVQGTGISNICGPMSFTGTFINGTSFSYMLRSEFCASFEFSSEPPFPTVTPCVTGVRGLSRVTTSL